MKQVFYSNGKLLLSSEYFVLEGATALAIPTKYGQSLEVEEIDSNETKLIWEAFDSEMNSWFHCVFDIDESLSIISTSNNKMAITLQTILLEAKRLNSNFLWADRGVKVQTKLDFPKNWGLGTSSTLINNIGQWAQVDAFLLLFSSFGGSGYDIACAQHNQPILYSKVNNKATITPCSLNWNFTNQIYFVFLNKKQNSKDSIAHFNTIKANKKILVKKLSQITAQMVVAASLTEFENLIDIHESILSGYLDLPTVKEQLFSDFSGSVKSLGGWGGDFVMATGTSAPAYFQSKGYNTVLTFNEMIL